MPPKKDRIADFLSHISQLETSGGKNLAHKEVDRGMQKGSTAVGQYGLMPLTIAEQVGKMDMAGKAASDADDGTQPIDPNAEDLWTLPMNLTEGMNPKSPEYLENAKIMAEQVANNPAMEQAIARFMAKNLLERTGGDDARAAYMWTAGHNRDPRKVTPQMMTPNEEMTPVQREAAQYSQKFRQLAQAANPDVPQLEEEPQPKRFASLQNKLR